MDNTRERRRQQSKRDATSLEEAAAQTRGPEATPSKSQFAIYDVGGRGQPVKNIFDASEVGDHRAILKYSKDKDFDVDAKDRYGRTALIWASDCSHLQICEDLIRLGASVNAQDTHTQRTALHWGARAGCLPVVRLLVQFGSKVNKEDKFGLTPLYLARTKGIDGEEVFKFLLSEGANFNENKMKEASEVEAKLSAELEAQRCANKT